MYNCNTTAKNHLIKQIPRNGEERLGEWHLVNCIRYKTAYSVQAGPFISAITLCHPSTVKKLLKTSEPKQVSDKSGYALLLEWLGR